MDINLIELSAFLNDEDKAYALVERLRWPNGPVCPREDCGSEIVYRLKVKGTKRRVLKCADCRRQFTVMVGTIFEDSHIPLSKWVAAFYMMCSSKKGISSHQIHRQLGISYKSALFMTHRIRYAMSQPPLADKLTGIVEVDETYIGGKARGRGRGYTRNKTMVVGAVQRGGNIRLRVAANNTAKILHGFINETVHDDAEAIYTDEHQSYAGIDDSNTRHETVHHKAEEWVRADVHTNTVESVWSLLKRSIVGSYHHLSARHLQAYLNEMAFRFNNRRNPYLFRDTMCKLIKAENLSYQDLVQKAG